MTPQIALAVIAALSAPLASWLTSVLMRQKYTAEIAALRADVDKKNSEIQGNELRNVRQGNDILMQQIVEPLRIEIKSLRSDVNKFRRAIEKIHTCPLHADCPVRHELQNGEKTPADGHAGKLQQHLPDKSKRSAREVHQGKDSGQAGSR